MFMSFLHLCKRLCMCDMFMRFKSGGGKDYVGPLLYSKILISMRISANRAIEWLDRSHVM